MKVMKRAILCLLLVFLLLSCSLPPESPVTRKQLMNTGIYRAFVVEEPPEEILNALNMKGELVIKATEGRSPVYVKIMATSEGLKISSYDR